MENLGEAVSVTRTIEAPAPVIFDLLRDPKMHPVFDGSSMLRGTTTEELVTKVGDVFSMQMHAARFGDYVVDNHVVGFELDRHIAWEPEARAHDVAAWVDDGTDRRSGQRWAFFLTPDGPTSTSVTETYDCTRASAQLREQLRDGQVWREAMGATLLRLDELCVERLAHR